MSPVHDPERSPRSDGEASRERLLRAGLNLFARQGFAKTSTRELAEAAGVNVASISYYFGDKAGLYRAVCIEPLGDGTAEAAQLADPALELAAALRVFYENFLEPLRHGDDARLCMKLHFREMLEPTGLWDQGAAQCIRPQHEALVALLCRHFGAARPDEAVQRLAICLAGLGVHLHVGRDVIDEIVPGLYAGADAIDRWVDTLAQLAMSMIEGEKRRRDMQPAPADAQHTARPARRAARQGVSKT
jgi:TetR/AcrR family transcriptional regulator, regulator of cefoperazone and chloramphenicol sensitivity